ncbi:MAG TPA: tripartite tricarboxylate transporter substrate binding protein [Usitatibacteraceae bacterium]|nr:tripartite tricarboxylate transporter substrate binding protein [Usitatibacteraceae bacterium]
MRFLAPLAAIAFAAASLGAQAAGYPSKNVTVVVPFPAGGSSDMVGRVVAQKLGEKLGGTFIVENKAGATGAIGAASVKNSPADGHTLLVSSLAVFVVNPHLQKSLPYDPSKDFDLLTVAVQAPNVLVATPDLPVKNVADVIALLKKEPGKISFATSGAGSSDHLTAELFWQETGAKGLHVPYKGGAPAISDLMAGHAQLSFQNVNAVLSQIRAGKLRALAITSAKRSPVLPDVPTLTEAGVKNAEVYSWQAVAAPRGLPADVKAKVHGAIVEGLKDPAVAKRLTDLGFEIVANTPEQFAAFQQAELARWKKVIATAGITAN